MNYVIRVAGKNKAYLAALYAILEQSGENTVFDSLEEFLNDCYENGLISDLDSASTKGKWTPYVHCRKGIVLETLDEIVEYFDKKNKSVKIHCQTFTLDKNCRSSVKSEDFYLYKSSILNAKEFFSQNNEVESIVVKGKKVTRKHIESLWSLFDD